MVDIFADLADVGFSVYQQGTAPEVLPESFATVWEYPSSDILHADNKAKQCRREWEIVFYTTDKTQIYSGLKTIISTLKKRGYLIDGQGYDASASWKDYDARAVDVVKIEELED